MSRPAEQAGWCGTRGRRRAWLRSRSRARQEERRDLEAGRAALQEQQPRPLAVLYEDNHLLVVNKPAGLLSQRDATGDPSVLELARDYLRQRYHKPGNIYLGLIHRLDRPVPGVLVLARTSKAARRLAQQLRERSMEKTYLAVVEGVPRPEQALLHGHLLKRGTGRRVTLLEAPTEESRPAELSYRILEKQQGSSLLEIHLITGRSHQIRAQLAELGHPLLGDLRYGSRVAPLAGAGPALCARRLRLLHPTSGEELTVEAPLPAGWPWPLPPELAEALAATGPRPRPARRPAAGRGRPAEASRPLEEPPAVLADGLEVLHLDDDLLALSKPAGLAVQRTLDPGRANLLEQAAALLVATGGARARPPALLTRLPSGASGLVLLARTRSGARAVQAQLQRRTLRRLFLLVVEGGPPPALAPGSWLEEQGCRVTVAGPVREGAFLLAVEPLSGPARAVEDLLAARGWQVRRLQGGRGDEGTAHGELRHLHRVRLHKSGQEQPLELVAPLPAAMARWCPGDESALPCFAEDERS